MEWLIAIIMLAVIGGILGYVGHLVSQARGFQCRDCPHAVGNHRRGMDGQVGPCTAMVPQEQDQEQDTGFVPWVPCGCPAYRGRLPK